ncbi:hypothetical protein PCASD_06725 [Puccinia coronata f. sp. avenae]|uniref:Rab-GAP TBC domain-containing protein n=1 Tax=Puccinia coronata f. sp. avenae TaxID=200324 RepID=A0A2N5TF87_9BASI|nr:hypothetical protein PCASD_06725 [Puccinia coronata f. sp. avenae]
MEHPLSPNEQEGNEEQDNKTESEENNNNKQNQREREGKNQGITTTTTTTSTTTETPTRKRLARDDTLKQHLNPSTRPNTNNSRSSSYHHHTPKQQTFTISLSDQPHLIPTKTKLLTELKTATQQLDQNHLESLMLSLIRELSSKLNQSQHDLKTSQLELTGLKNLLINTYSVGSGEIERCLVRARVPDQPSQDHHIPTQPTIIKPTSTWQLELNDYSPDQLSTSTTHSLLFSSSSRGPSCSSTQLDLDDLREAMSDNPCFDTTTSSSSCRSRSQLTSPASLNSHVPESPIPITTTSQPNKKTHSSASKLFSSSAILNGKYRKSAPIPPVPPFSDHHHHHHNHHNHGIEELAAAAPRPSSSSSTLHKRTASIGSSLSGVSSAPGHRQPANNVWGLYGWKWNKRDKASHALSSNGETEADGGVRADECISPENELACPQLGDSPLAGPTSLLDGDHEAQLKHRTEPGTSRSRPKRSPTEASSSTILSGLFDSLTRRKRTESNQSHLQKPSLQSFNSRAAASASCEEPSPGSAHVSSSLVTRSPSLILNSSSSINTQTTSTSSSCSVDDPTPHPQIDHPLTGSSLDLTLSLPSLVRKDSEGPNSSSESALSSTAPSALHSSSPHSDTTPPLGGTDILIDTLDRSLDPSLSTSQRPAGSDSVTKLVRNPAISSDSSAANRRPSLINLKSPAESFVSTSKGLPTLATHAADMIVHSERFQLPSSLSGLSADNNNSKHQSTADPSINRDNHTHVSPDGDSSSLSQSVDSSVNGPATTSNTEINNERHSSSRLRSPPSHHNLSLRSSKSSVVASASQMKSKPQVKITQSATTKSYLSTATGTIGKALGGSRNNPLSSQAAAIPAEFEPNVTTVPNAAFGRLASVYFGAPDSRPSGPSSSSRSLHKAGATSILSTGQAPHHHRLVANMIPGIDALGGGSSSAKHPVTLGIPAEPINHHDINKLNFKFIPPLSNSTMELSTFVNPQSNPPLFSNFSRDDDARGLDAPLGPSPSAADDEPIIDRFGFIVDAKYGLKLMRKSRDKQKQLAKERLAALEQPLHQQIPSQPPAPLSPPPVDSTNPSELPTDSALPSEASSTGGLNSPSSRAVPLAHTAEENTKFNSSHCDASVEGSDLDHTPMMTTALPIKSQVDVEAELSSLREALGLSPAIKAGSKDPETSSTTIDLSEIKEANSSSSSPVDPLVESSTQSIRRLLFQLNEMQNMLEKKQMEAWGQFITKRRMKLMRVSNSTSPHALVATASSDPTNGSTGTIQGTGAVSPASVGAFLGTGSRPGNNSGSGGAEPIGTMSKTPHSGSGSGGQQSSKRQIGEAALAAATGAGATGAAGGKVHDLITCHDDNLIGLASMGLSNDNKKALKDEWKEFKALIIQGIPISLRPKIWLECSGASDRKEPGYYHDLLILHAGEEGLCLNQIECDVTRTLPTNVYFGGDGPGVSKLRRVLAAMSWHNPVVGYCQGMNMVAATLLLTIPSEEDAFWILVCIVDQILPPHYYTSHLLTSQADQRVLKQLVRKHLPELADHLDALDVELPAITFGWFLSLFADALPIQTLLRVFDIFLIDGSVLLFRISLALLKINQGTIRSYDSPASLYAYMRGPMTLSSHHADRLVAVATTDFPAVNNPTIAALRTQFVQQIKQEMGLPE